MKTRFIALNLVLVAALAAVYWQARVRWTEAKARRDSNINVRVKAAKSVPPAPAVKPDAPPAAHYADVATKDLFSKDRNPTVVIEPPKVEAPKPMPPLPVVYGVLGMPSGVRALMAERAGAPSQPVRQGDNIGQFKVIALDTQNVTFEWDGKEIAKKVDDLIDREGPGAGGSAPGAPPPPSQAVSSGPAIPLPQPGQQPSGQPANQPNTSLQSNVLGVEVGLPGASQRTCLPGDNSAPGTVVDGYRKTVTATPFGSSCRWMPAGQ